MDSNRKKFDMVVCGGTFDHLHKGHKEFLRFVFSLSSEAVIGLTSDRYIKDHKVDDGILPYEERKRELIYFLKQESLFKRAIIVKIDNLYGPTLQTQFPLQAIVISQETKKGAEEINFKRKKLRLSPLEIIIAPFVKGENNKTISAFDIRRGIIDREGKLYIKPIWISQSLQLTDRLRVLLKEPFGQLMKGEKNLIQKSKSFRVSTVGDVTTKLFNDLSLGQNISVVDFAVGRKKKFSKLTQLGFLGKEEVIEVNNPASFLTPSLFCAATKAFSLSYQKKKVIIKVNGEEDLAVLPLVLAAPLGSVIWYGQPKEGIVRVIVTEETKQKAYEIAEQFSFNTRGH